MVHRRARPQHGLRSELPGCPAVRRIMAPPSQPVANKQPAPIAILSTAKRTALIECFNNSGLYKQNGSWRGLPDSMRISGCTVADLGRDGLLLVIMNGRCAGSAQLTERGAL